MSEKQLAAVALLDSSDPTLLTSKEITDSYGSPFNFFMSYGLKPWEADDCEEARDISRAMKAAAVEEAADEEVDEVEEVHSDAAAVLKDSVSPSWTNFLESGSGYNDETLACKDCNSDFVFTSGEQEFYAQKGFDNKPIRCKACKDAKKDRMGGGGGGGGDRRGGGGGGGGGTCYAFQKGECSRGSSCKFSHSGRGGGHGRGGGGRGGVCYANQKGECSRGSSCRFSHG